MYSCVAVLGSRTCRTARKHLWCLLYDESHSNYILVKYVFMAHALRGWSRALHAIHGEMMIPTAMIILTMKTRTPSPIMMMMMKKQFALFIMISIILSYACTIRAQGSRGDDRRSHFSFLQWSFRRRNFAVRSDELFAQGHVHRRASESAEKLSEIWGRRSMIWYWAISCCW